MGLYWKYAQLSLFHIPFNVLGYLVSKAHSKPADQSSWQVETAVILRWQLQEVAADWQEKWKKKKKKKKRKNF